MAAVILAVVLPLSGGDPMRAVTLASMMAIVSGAVCILAGLARLGFITELLSKPIRYGYMNGIALTVFISQLPKLFGFSIEHGGPIRDLWAIGKAVLSGQVNWTTFLIGVGTLTVILLLKGSKTLPGILIAVVGATIVVGAMDLAERADVSVLGPLPQGLPSFTIPWITSNDLIPVLSGGLRSRPRLLRRYQRSVAILCGTDPYVRRPQPGDGGSWSRQLCGRVFSGLSD